MMRSDSRGLTAMPDLAGSVICFACAPNQTAEDGTGRNGTYTKHLLQHLPTPQTDVDKIMRRVGAAVEAETNQRQKPYVNSAIRVEDAFLTSGVATASPPAKPGGVKTMLMPPLQVPGMSSVLIESDAASDASPREVITLCLQGDFSAFDASSPSAILSL